MSAPAQTVPPVIGEARELVIPALRKAVATLCPGVARIAAYHHGWQDAFGRPVSDGGGKLLRPALALLSARAARATPEAGVPGAVAVELIHAFSLLHDDIMDGDTERRHRPTAWTVFGTPAALLTGNALLVAGVSALLDQGTSGAMRAATRLTETLQRVVTGQHADLDFEGRDDISLAECLQMAAGKTGALLGCSAAIGAEVAGAPVALADGLARFGEEIGLAFQLVDDLLGIWGSPEITGKPVLSDLRARKKTLPVVAALWAGCPSSHELRELYLRPAPLTEIESRQAAGLIERSGGKDWARREAERRLVLARQHLDDLKLPTSVRAEFLDIAEFVTERTH